MDDDRRLERFDQLQDGRPVADIQLVMGEAGQRPPQPLLVPAGIALRAEEGLALVIVHAVDGQAAPMEEDGDFRADQAGGAGYQTVLIHTRPMPWNHETHEPHEKREQRTRFKAFGAVRDTGHYISGYRSPAAAGLSCILWCH